MDVTEVVLLDVTSDRHAVVVVAHVRDRHAADDAQQVMGRHHLLGQHAKALHPRASIPLETAYIYLRHEPCVTIIIALPQNGSMLMNLQINLEGLVFVRMKGYGLP